MDTLSFTVQINAPKQKVWDVMLADATYRQWTGAFHEGSYYQGSWEKGSKILFLGPSDDDSTGPSGMVGQIAENRPYEFISIEYSGEVVDGQEDTTSDSAKQWAGAHENYSFSEADDVTTLKIDLEGAGINPEMKAMFQQMWPVALDKLKELAEA